MAITIWGLDFSRVGGMVVWILHWGPDARAVLAEL